MHMMPKIIQFQVGTNGLCTACTDECLRLRRETDALFNTPPPAALTVYSAMKRIGPTATRALCVTPHTTMNVSAGSPVGIARLPSLRPVCS